MWLLLKDISVYWWENHEDMACREAYPMSIHLSTLTLPWDSKPPPPLLRRSIIWWLTATLPLWENYGGRYNCFSRLTQYDHENANQIQNEYQRYYGLDLNPDSTIWDNAYIIMMILFQNMRNKYDFHLLEQQEILSRDSRSSRKI